MGLDQPVERHQRERCRADLIGQRPQLRAPHRDGFRTAGRRRQIAHGLLPDWEPPTGRPGSIQQCAISPQGLSQNLFSIVFSRNSASEMKKRDGLLSLRGRLKESVVIDLTAMWSGCCPAGREDRTAGFVGSRCSRHQRGTAIRGRVLPVRRAGNCRLNSGRLTVLRLTSELVVRSGRARTQRYTAPTSSTSSSGPPLFRTSGPLGQGIGTGHTFI